MICIKGNKMIDTHRAECLLQIKVQENRPDIIWYLREMGRWGLSPGETENMEDYLAYLNLMSGGELTQEGEKAIETGNVMVPEAGIYEVLYTKDTALGNRIINIQRKRPRDMIEGNTQDFPDYELFDQKTHTDLNTGKYSMGDFWVQFERQRGENPKIIYTGTLEAELELRHKEDETTLKFTFNKGNVKINYETPLRNFNLEKNMKTWFKTWDIKTSSIETTYEEAKKNPAMLKNFYTTKHLEGQQIEMPDGLDDSDWKLEISVPVAPKTEKDIEKWLNYLITENLEKIQRYIRKEQIEKIQTEIIKGSPISTKFPDYFESGEEILQKLRKNNSEEIFYMVQAAEDLTPKVREGNDRW